MTRLTPLLTSKKTLNITYATPRETLLDPVQTLPTSEPTDPQISYTVLESDLPTLSLKPFSKVWLARVLGGGQNQSGASATVYWRMLKNGQSVATSSESVSNNYYYVVTAGFFNVQVGDVLALKIWSNQNNVILSRHGLAVHVSRIYLFSKIVLNKDVKIVTTNSASAQPFQYFGQTLGAAYGNTAIYNGISQISYIAYNAYTLNIPFFAIVSPIGFIQTGLGDYTIQNSAKIATSTTATNTYYSPFPTQIIARGVLID
jgi:hypothetical protein